MKAMKFNPLARLGTVVVLALTLAACGGSSSTAPEPPGPTALQTATSKYDEAKTAYDALMTGASTDEERVAAAMALKVAADDLETATAADASSTAADLSAAQMKAADAAKKLMMAEKAKADADAMAAAAAKLEELQTAHTNAMAAYDALGDDASNADRLAAAMTLHAAAKDLHAELVERDAPSSQVMMAMAAVTAAQAKVDMANQMIADAAAAAEEAAAAETRRTAQEAMIVEAIKAARTAVAGVNDESTDEEVDAAKAAVAAATAKITEAADVSEDAKTAHTASVTTIQESLNAALDRRTTALANTAEFERQKMAISTAINAARAAVDAVMDDSEDSVVDAAMKAIADAKVVIAGAEAIDDDVKDANNETLNAISQRLDTAKASRMTAMEAKDAAMKAKDAAMMATAMKLHKGIGELPIGGTGEATRTAASAATGVISVTMGTAAAVPLAVDKKTMVPDNHGWMGKKHTAEPTGDVGTYEARVYSDVGDSTPGDPFDLEYADNFANGTLDTATTSGTASRVASPSFDQSAGVKSFKKGENLEQVVIAGSYHGVAGSYYCTPAANSKCAAQKAATGFTLGGTDADDTFTASGGTWTFKPSNPKAKVMSVDDVIYASYGWWLHKSEDGDTYTASAFTAYRGAVEAAAGITVLQGTATYMGGAAGKYALYSSTGGTNDAGHFTARATLEADFNDDMITGTINQFMGADGESRPWSVELMKQGVSDTGTILGDDGTGTAGTDEKMTKWTIDGTAAAAGGQWSGTLYDNGADSVPKVATGTFHSEYGNEGRMVGAFGANKQ